MSLLASGPFIDWEELTGQSKFVVDIVSVPIFSAVAGILTNWTGVLMMFAPAEFHGFRCPGLKTLFPFFHPKVKVLPCWAPGGIVGFQGIVPSRSEKIGSLCVDMAIARIGSMSDFFRELDPDVVADQLADVAVAEIRPMIATVIAREHPELWTDLPDQLRSAFVQRVASDLPAIMRRSLERVGDNIEHLIDIKMFVVRVLRDDPKVMKDLLEGLGGPELRLMIKIGLLGFPFGIFLALYLQVHARIPFVGDYISSSWMVLIGAAAIGVIVNIIAIKVVFEPSEPAPRYKYLWRQAAFAKRQHEAAGDFGHALAYRILTLDNIADELLHGPRGDRTVGLIDSVLSDEIRRVLGPSKGLVRAALGAEEFDAILKSAPDAAISLAAKLLDHDEFMRMQSNKVDEFASARMRALSPTEFMELLYSTVEQDAWLLYVHGGFMGVFVGAAHLLLFGA